MQITKLSYAVLLLAGMMMGCGSSRFDRNVLAAKCKAKRVTCRVVENSLGWPANYSALAYNERGDWWTALGRNPQAAMDRLNSILDSPATDPHKEPIEVYKP